MLLIAELIGTDARRFKAPKNMMYLISGINFANGSTTGLFLHVFDQLLEDEVVNASSRLRPIATYRTGIAGDHHFIGNIDHKCKFITIVKNVATAINTFVQIYGDVIPASKMDLIWEWFRKGR